MKKSSFILACLLISSACSKVEKKVQIIERSTEEVTHTQSNETEQKMTSHLFEQISQEAADRRDEKFQILMEEEAEMGSRLSAAIDYFGSFDFQLAVNKDKSQSLYSKAVNEFSLKVSDLFWKINPYKLNPMNEDNKLDMSFYALSAALDESGDSSESFYDLMKKALLKDHQHEKLLDHEELLVSGINREIMIELIRARVDITATMALKNLTDKRDMTLGQKAKALIFQITGGRLGSIDLPETYDKSNDATKSSAQKHLEASIEARDFLKSINVNKSLEKRLSSAYSKIDFNEKNSVKNDKALDQKKEQIRSLIQDLLD